MSCYAVKHHGGSTAPVAPMSSLHRVVQRHPKHLSSPDVPWPRGDGAQHNKHDLRAAPAPRQDDTLREEICPRSVSPAGPFKSPCLRAGYSVAGTARESYSALFIRLTTETDYYTSTKKSRSSETQRRVLLKGLTPFARILCTGQWSKKAYLKSRCSSKLVAFLFKFIKKTPVPCR